MSLIAKTLGNRIKKIRQQAGMSQEELAFKSHISTTYLGQLERAEKSPTLDVLIKISNAFGISLSELFAFETDPDTKTDSTYLNKINAQLSSLSEKELAEILKLIRNLKAFKNL